MNLRPKLKSLVIILIHAYLNCLFSTFLNYIIKWTSLILASAFIRLWCFKINHKYHYEAHQFKQEQRSLQVPSVAHMLLIVGQISNLVQTSLEENESSVVFPWNDKECSILDY